MTNPDLDKIIASMDVAIRQAYALGRRDALDHVARWAQTEETTPTQLALVAPSDHAAPQDPATADFAGAPHAQAGRAPSAPDASRAHRPRGFGALLLDYVYPSS